MTSIKMNSIASFVRLARPLNMLICFLAVVCGSIIGDKPLSVLTGFLNSIAGGFLPAQAFRILAASVSASFILAAGNTFNDICDDATDSINAPHRPVPAGRVSVRAAYFSAVVLLFIGLLTALPLGSAGVVIAVLAALSLAVYDLRLKKIPFAGNLIVAFLGGLSFLYGGIAGNCVKEALIPAAFAFMFHLGREIIKDAADYLGDKRAGIDTIATVYGTDAACRASSLVLAVLAAGVTVPSITGYFGALYMAIVTFGVCTILMYVLTSSLRDSSEVNLRRLSTLLKADMPVGIIAVLAGFQGW